MAMRGASSASTLSTTACTWGEMGSCLNPPQISTVFPLLPLELDLPLSRSSWSKLARLRFRALPADFAAELSFSSDRVASWAEPAKASLPVMPTIMPRRNCPTTPENRVTAWMAVFSIGTKTVAMGATASAMAIFILPKPSCRVSSWSDSSLPKRVTVSL